MKVVATELNKLVEQGKAHAIGGRWFVEVEVIYPDVEMTQAVADKLPEPLPFDAAEAEAAMKALPKAADRPEPKRGR